MARSVTAASNREASKSSPRPKAPRLTAPRTRPAVAARAAAVPASGARPTRPVRARSPRSGVLDAPRETTIRSSSPTDGVSACRQVVSPRRARSIASRIRSSGAPAARARSMARARTGLPAGEAQASRSPSQRETASRTPCMGPAAASAAAWARRSPRRVAARAWRRASRPGSAASIISGAGPAGRPIAAAPFSIRAARRSPSPRLWALRARSAASAWRAAPRSSAPPSASIQASTWGWVQSAGARTSTHRSLSSTCRDSRMGEVCIRSVSTPGTLGPHLAAGNRCCGSDGSDPQDVEVS